MESCGIPSSLCKNHWEKQHRAFVKVVEGPKIYNFAYYTSNHFSCKFWSKTRSSRGKPKRCHAGTRMPRATSPWRATLAPPPYVAVRTPRWARDNRSVHRASWNASPCHAPRSPSSIGQPRRRPAGLSAPSPLPRTRMPRPSSYPRLSGRGRLRREAMPATHTPPIKPGPHHPLARARTRRQPAIAAAAELPLLPIFHNRVTS
jgi:hypothetical protein